jgi:hypothetical protein
MSDPGVRGKNLFGQNAVNLLIGIEAGVLENDTAEIQVKGAPHHAFGIRHETEDSLLKIQRQKHRFLGFEFQALFLSVSGQQAVMTFPPCA